MWVEGGRSEQVHECILSPHRCGVNLRAALDAIGSAASREALSGFYLLLSLSPSLSVSPSLSLSLSPPLTPMNYFRSNEVEPVLNRVVSLLKGLVLNAVLSWL